MFLKTRINKALVQDVFSLHQMLYLLGNDQKDKEAIINIIKGIIISHISKCQYMMKNTDDNPHIIFNNCYLCAMDINQLFKADFFTLFYEYTYENHKFKINNYNSCYSKDRDTKTIDAFFSAQLIELFILYYKKRVYSFYLKLNSLQYQWRHKASFQLNLSSLFDYLIKQVGEESNHVCFEFFYRLNSLKKNFETFLEKFSMMTTSSVHNQYISLNDYLNLGNSIIDLKKEIKELENDQIEFFSSISTVSSAAIPLNIKTSLNIRDNFVYIFNIIRFSTAKLINDDNICSNYPHQTECLNEEFMDNYYHHNKMLLLKMVFNPNQLFKHDIQIIYIGERYNKEETIKKNFFKLFPKRFRQYCEYKLNDCLNKYSKVFNFFLMDLNNCLVDFHYDLNLIPYDKDLLIKGEVFYNQKNLLLFKWNKQDEEYILQNLSKKSSQILKIEPYLLEYGLIVNITFSFNELFYVKDNDFYNTNIAFQKKEKLYYLYSTKYLRKLEDITKHFLDNKTNASYTSELKHNCDLLLNQKECQVKLYEIDMLEDYNGDNSFQMFLLKEKNNDEKYKKKTNKSTMIDCTQDSSHIIHKLKELGSSSVASSISEISTIFNKKQNKSNQAHQYENKFFALTIMVISFDIFIIIITVTFLIIQYILNRKLKESFQIFIQEKRIECYFAHITIEIFMTICVYDQEGINISNRLEDYSQYMNIDFRPYLFEELIEKQKIFNNLTADYLLNLYSSNDEENKQLSQATVNLSYLSNQLNGNQLTIKKMQLGFTEGIKFFSNILNEIISYSNSTSCQDKAISIIQSDRDIPYFINLNDAKLNSYQMNIYSLVLNFMSYYQTFDKMRVLLYEHCLQYYDYHIIGLIIIFVLLCCSKATVVSLCFLSITLAKTILLNELNDINRKIDNDESATYFKTQIKNIKIMCQLHQENPLSLMSKIVKCRQKFYLKQYKEQHDKKNKCIIMNNKENKVNYKSISNSLSKINDKQINGSQLSELFKIPKLFLSSLIIVIIIVSSSIPLFLNIFLLKIKIVIDYSEINFLVESSLFIPAVMTNIMLLSNKGSMPIDETLYSDNSSIMTIIKSIELLRNEIIQKDIFRSQYLPTLKSLDQSMITDSCQITFEHIDDKILITIRQRGFNYNTFYHNLCTSFNYNFVNYQFSFYDIEYRLQNFITNSLVFDYKNIHRVLNDINAMTVFSILLFISRPIVNYYNTTSLHDKLFNVADTYMIILLISLISDTMINFVVFYFLEKIVMGKFNTLTKSAVTLNKSIIVNKE